MHSQRDNRRLCRSVQPPISSRAKIYLTSAAILLVGTFPNVYGYSNGAPAVVCGSMVPSHQAEPQTGPNPYKVTISKNAIMGLETLDITLTSKTGNDQFKGFLIQVRKDGSDTPAGHFSDPVEEDIQTVDCPGVQKSAMTHTSSDLKNRVTAHWVAPNAEDAEYQIFYTVVGLEGTTFWSHTPHEEKIRVTRNTQATTTAAPIRVVSAELKEKWKEVYDGCGVNKGCFGIPGKCVEQYDNSDDPTTCSIMVTWSSKGGINVFELTGKSGSQNSYMALGLSNDAFMGKDSVVACTHINGETAIARFHNDEKAPPIKHANASFGLNPISKNTIDGNIFCKFEQTDHKIDDVDINFQNNHYMLLARGTAAQSRLDYHSTQDDRQASPQAVHVTDVLIMGASAQKWLIHLHGGFMIIAWLLCASTGMFTARYLKLTHTDFTPCGKAFWFALHITCMAATVFLTICGAVFIFISKKYTLEFSAAHPILGAIVIGLAIVQVIIAFLRPHPGTPSRPYFNWFHWAVGNSAHIVGIVCILMASELNLADLKRFGDENLWGWILLGIVLFHVLMHIVMSIHTLWADKQMDSNNKKRAVQMGPMKNNGLSSEAPGTGFRTFMLSLYLLVMAAGAIVLTALVSWPKSADNAPTS